MSEFQASLGYTIHENLFQKKRLRACSRARLLLHFSDKYTVLKKEELIWWELLITCVHTKRFKSEYSSVDPLWQMCKNLLREWRIGNASLMSEPQSVGKTAINYLPLPVIEAIKRTSLQQGSAYLAVWGRQERKWRHSNFLSTQWSWYQSPYN